MDHDYQPELAGSRARTIRSRLTRTPRVVSTAAASVILLGSGVGIGMALTGSASAASGHAAPASHAAPRTAAGECARLARALRDVTLPAGPKQGTPTSRAARLARLAAALCRDPLLRLAAVGGSYGEVTFNAKAGTRILAFERGTVQTATASVLVVRAADGTTMTWHIGARSVVRQDGHKVAAGKLAAGDTVFVGGQVVGGADEARLIRIRKTG